jgi:uncharacterized protein with LGFP repeats
LEEKLGAPRRRHAVEDSRTGQFDAVIEEPAARVDYEADYHATYQPRYEDDYQPDYQQLTREEADEPWRPAIHLPLADPFQAPEGYWIKGNTHSGLYYTPESVLYDNTIPEVWFASEDVAQANGFVRAPE